MTAKKQVVFCTYSSVYSSIVLDTLLKDKQIDIVAIVNSRRVLSPNYGHFRGVFEQIRKTGIRYATYLFFVTDAFSWLQPLLRLNNSSLKTVAKIAKERKIPLYETRDINNKSTIDFISQFTPDYILAAHFNQLIKTDVLALPKVSCLNIHPSLLPAYKGVDPVFYAILDSQTDTGVTLHKMSETFDTGEIYSQKVRSISPNESVFEKNCQLFLDGAKLATNWIGLSDSECIKTPAGSDRYDSWPTVDKIKVFKKSGNCLITFSSFLQGIRKE